MFPFPNRKPPAPSLAQLRLHRSYPNNDCCYCCCHKLYVNNPLSVCPLSSLVLRLFFLSTTNSIFAFAFTTCRYSFCMVSASFLPQYTCNSLHFLGCFEGHFRALPFVSSVPIHSSGRFSHSVRFLLVLELRRISFSSFVSFLDPSVLVVSPRPLCSSSSSHFGIPACPGIRSDSLPRPADFADPVYITEVKYNQRKSIKPFCLTQVDSVVGSKYEGRYCMKVSTLYKYHIL